MSQQFVIIGLGRLGTAMIGTLEHLGHDVLGIDSDEGRIQDLSGRFPNAHLVAADATDESVLRDLNVAQFDGAAVVIGENLEASILATVNLKELDVPFVVARALSKLHRRVLEKIGADRVIEPEREMGAQVARTMASPPSWTTSTSARTRPSSRRRYRESGWAGASPSCNSRKSGLTVLALRPKGQSGTIPSGDTALNEGDVIVVGGRRERLDRSRLLQPGSGR